MAEIKTPLIENSDGSIILTENHTYADIVRYLLIDHEKEELKNFIDWVEE